MRAMGMQLHLVTNKRRLPTRRILEVLGWWGLFSSVNTLDSSAHATSKTDVVAGLLTESDIPKFSTRLVGDSLDDAIAARDNGIAFLWARWGYGRDPLLATMGASLDNIRQLMNNVLTRVVAAWRNSQRIRFIAIGAYNTAFGYACFAILYLAVGHRINYLLILVAAHFLSVCNAFLWHRCVTFRSSAYWPAEFARFNVSYLGALVFGLMALRVLVGGLKFDPLAAAAVVTALTVALSYVLHQRFSFRILGEMSSDRRNGRGNQ
jgi:putative flippase GtrA